MDKSISINISQCPRCEKPHQFTVDIEGSAEELDYQINIVCPNQKRLLRLTKFHLDFSRNAHKHTPNGKRILESKYGSFNIEEKEKR